jgi:S-phase kinase-associated protein 1
LPNVASPILSKIVEYLAHHKDDPPYVEEEGGSGRLDNIEAWDVEFCKVDQGTLFDLILVSLAKAI